MLGLGLIIAPAGLFATALWDASALHQALGSRLDETTVVLGAMTLSIVLTTFGYVLRRASELAPGQASSSGL